MKTNVKKLCKLLPVAAAMLLATGCVKETSDFRILAIAEESEQDADKSDTKTRLWNESHVYWDDGDEINVRYLDREGVGRAIFSIGNTDPGTPTNQQAIFVMQNEVKVPENGTGYYLAMFPYHENNHLGEGGNGYVINFASNQGYVGDNSFGRAACPMVAYGKDKEGEGENALVRLLFHNLAGLVRIQIIDSIDNALSSDPVRKLVNLSFTTTSKSPNKQLSGPFTVKDFDKNSPSLTPLKDGSLTAEQRTTTITPSGGTIPIPVHNNRGREDKEPLTFYLVLPAVNGTGNNGYEVTMTVTAMEGSKTVHVQKTFSANVRRNGITKMPTLMMRAWAAEESDPGTATGGITGNGTESRPFLIYSAKDLAQLREACNNGTMINGKRILNGVYVRIMRAFTLDNTNWQEGIRNFRGTMTYGASQSSTEQGITLNTNVPIFASIGDGGEVLGLPVKGACTWANNASNVGAFSPLCHTNKGLIADCMVSDDARYDYVYYGTSDTVGIGGLCVVNKGIIKRSGCRGHLAAPRVGGICLFNQGIITQCFIPSPMRAFVGSDIADSVGGICFCNEDSISDCYFAANINLSTARWGGIAFQNKAGGRIHRCYVDQSGIIQSENSVGGIVHTFYGGLLDYCWNDADLLLVEKSGGLGSIVYDMKKGTVRNCYCRRPSGSMTCKKGVLGGLVATMRGGMVLNSYVYSDMSQSVCPVKGIFVGDFQGGRIENCYGEQWSTLGDPMPFFGNIAADAVLVDCYGRMAQSGGSDGSSGTGAVTAYTGNEAYTTLLTALRGHTGWATGTTRNYHWWKAAADGPAELEVSATFANHSR